MRIVFFGNRVTPDSFSRGIPKVLTRSSHMATSETTAQQDHLRWEQDHLRWSAEHMRALSILRRIESRLYAHEVEIMTHRAEIAAHEHAHQHGSATPVRTQIASHDAGGARHAESARRHNELMQAIFTLDRLLEPNPNS